MALDMVAHIGYHIHIDSGTVHQETNMLNFTTDTSLLNATTTTQRTIWSKFYQMYKNSPTSEGRASWRASMRNSVMTYRKMRYGKRTTDAQRLSDHRRVFSRAGLPVDF